MRSNVLVGLQLVALTVLFWPATGRGWGGPAAGLGAVGVAWLAWTMVANRPGNFDIRPEPKLGARLATTGPYRLVRHPMYFGGLVASAGLVTLWPVWWKVVAWIALLAIFVAKARIEERALVALFPDYDAYRRARRFLCRGCGSGARCHRGRSGWF